MSAFAVVPSALGGDPASDCDAVAHALTEASRALRADGAPRTGAVAGDHTVHAAVRHLAAAVDGLAREAARDADALRASCGSYADVERRLAARVPRWR